MCSRNRYVAQWAKAVVQTHIEVCFVAGIFMKDRLHGLPWAQLPL